MRGRSRPPRSPRLPDAGTWSDRSDRRPRVATQLTVLLQRGAVEVVSRQPGEARDDVGGSAPPHSRGDELGDGRVRVLGGGTVLRDGGRSEDKRDLPTRRLLIPRRELRERPARNLFEALRQLAAHRRLPLWHCLGKPSERRSQPPRRLERDHRMRPARDLRRERTQLTGPAWEIPDELVALPDKPAGDERGLDGRRPGKHRHGKTSRDGRRDQPCSRVVDPRQPRVRDQRHLLTAAEPPQHLFRPRGLVVAVIAEEPRVDPVAIQENTGPPRVLAEHDVCGAQLPEHPQRHVLEVPDRRRADRERHQPAPSPSRAAYPTSAVPISPASVPNSADTNRGVASAGARAGTRAAACARSSRKSPAAWPNPPPTTTSSGSKRFASEAMPAPR